MQSLFVSISIVYFQVYAGLLYAALAISLGRDIITPRFSANTKTVCLNCILRHVIECNRKRQPPLFAESSIVHLVRSAQKHLMLDLTCAFPSFVLSFFLSLLLIISHMHPLTAKRDGTKKDNKAYIAN